MINFFLEKNRIYIFIFIISIVAYHFSYGLNTLLPTNIGWLLNAYHDWGQHYLGAAFYRQEEWHYPIGQMNSFYYPVGTNVGFTDCTPIMALLTKIFSFFLPEDFQYFGLWLWSCFFLNAFYSVKILKLFTKNTLIILLCSTLIMVNPLLLFRGMQASACAHWLFLGSFYYYLKPTTKINVVSNFKKQGLLMLLSTLINPYLSIMTAGFVIILPLKNYFYDSSLTLKKVFILPSITFILSIFIWIIFGMIEFESKTNLDVGSIYGTMYAFNLNSFINSYGFYSKFIPNLGKVEDTQHEGFAYLGLGMIILLIITLFYLIFLFATKRVNKKYSYLLPLVFLCGIMLIFAITNVVTLGTEVLFEYPTLGIIKKVGNIFRAVGRFSWPFYYLLYCIAFIIFIKIRINQTIKIIFLSFILLLQFYDIENLITSRDLKSGGFDSKLDEKAWKQTMEQFNEILVYPPYQNNMVYPMDYQDLMFVALQSKKPISIGYVAREKVDEGLAYKDTLYNQIKKGEIKDKQIFVTNKKNLKDFDVLIHKGQVNFRILDNFYLLFSNKSTFGKSYEMNEREQFFMDSIKKKFNSNPFLLSLNNQWKSKEEIKFNIEKFSFLNDVIQINGWAFDQNQVNNEKDSIFISLQGENNYFLYPVEQVERGDVSASNAGKKLDNSGFTTTIFIDQLPKMNYDIGIVIKNKEGLYSYTKTDKICEKGKRIYQEVIRIDQLPSPSEDVLGNFEVVRKSKKDVFFSGWGVIKDVDSNEYTISIILIDDKDKTNNYLIETNAVIRNDVTNSFKNKVNYDKSGYSAKIKPTNIITGTYRLGIIIKTNNLTKLKMFDKKINL